LCVFTQEAAEILEAHTISALSANIEHVILIGDHRQLRPKVNVYDLQCDSKMGYDMDRSLFERLVEDKSAGISVLSTQYRMRPEISELVRRTIYPHLVNAESTLTRLPVRGMCKCLFFWDHRIPEDRYSASDMSACSAGIYKSKSNSHEIKCVLALATYLLKQGYKPEQITVLTGYISQSSKIAKSFKENGCSVFMSERDIDELQRQGELNVPPGGRDELQNHTNSNNEITKVLDLKASAIRIATIDNFQGVTMCSFKI
jgi:superfamily I DNA and/or RNA helicase